MMAAGASALGLGPDNYLPTMVVLIGWYFKQLLWPSQVLLAKMIQPIQGNLFAWNVGIIVFIAVSGVVLLRSNNQRLRLLVFWFLVGLAPLSLACLIYPSEGILIEPHWFMIGSLSFYWGAAWIFQTIRHKSGFLASVIIFIMVLVVTAVYTQKYNYLWRNQRSYCLYWLSLEPQQQLPNFWLATDYLNTNELPLARAYFMRALTNSSIDWEVYVNLGTISYKEGKLQEAISWNQKALMLNPKSADAFNNLGIVAWEQKDGVAAREFFKKAIAADPSFYKAADNLKIVSAPGQ
jgi:tetratricopeptide (TPR) repeat protein